MHIISWLWNLDKSRKLGLASSGTTLIYLTFLALNVHGWFGWCFWVLEVLVGLFTLLVVFNHWTRQYELVGGTYSLRSPVDVFIPMVNEPLGMIENTVKAATEIDHPNTTVYLLDDGGRAEVKALAKKYHCHYLSRPDRAAKRYKAANLNYALTQSYAPYILVLDADNVVNPAILDDLLGHFSRDKVAIVASRQVFTIDKDDFNHDHLFYDYLQAGKNKDNAAISCGSGVIYARKYLKEIGGFSEWNVVEDLHTSYLMHSAGYRTVYVTQPYTQGTAPSDISQVYKQRGTWALDTLRVFFWQQPLTRKGLTWRQRLHYFEIGYCYLVSAFFLPGIFVANFYSLLFNDPIVHGGLWYLVTRLPDLLFTLTYFGRLSHGQLSSRVWAGLFPAYQMATIKALLHRHTVPTYKVTSKLAHGAREARLVLPQLIMAGSGIFCLVYNFVRYGLSGLLLISTFWVCLMLFWLWPIVIKAVTGKDKIPWQKLYSLPKTSRVY
ncbi:MAG TPA: cellulose synthase catalytic subunit [Candidatus Saccharimonadia bacterium]|nr:cellulose synthase catalytic subunit [Candidatus Saccharimonadia bacterium]